MHVKTLFLLDFVRTISYDVRMKLYRATHNQSDAKDVPIGTSWSPDLSTAEAYTDNPGFGGPHIVSIVARGDVCDYTDANGGLRQLIRDMISDEDIAHDLLSEWSGYEVFQCLESCSLLRRVVEERCDWLAYSDDFPPGATTYRRMR